MWHARSSSAPPASWRSTSRSQCGCMNWIAAALSLQPSENALPTMAAVRPAPVASSRRSYAAIEARPCSRAPSNRPLSSAPELLSRSRAWSAGLSANSSADSR